MKFVANGAGRILSTGSDIDDHGSLFVPERRMRAGKVTVAVKLGEKAGALSLMATAEGLQRGILNIEVK